MSDAFVVDSSAFLALLFREPGAEVIDELLAADAMLTMSAVNLAEVVARLVDRGWSEADLLAAVAAVAYRNVDFTREMAVAAGLLRSQTRALGLSAGDRACLALALSESLPVLTADRPWSELSLDIAIRQIR